MSYSPAVSVPEDPKEQPILDRLLNIRTQLELLRQDKSKPVQFQDVLQRYEQVIEQVKVLNEIRKQKRYEQNRVDHVLDDCFQLISLSYLAAGKTQELPAVYAAVSTVKRLLDHLKEAAFFCPADLHSLQGMLGRYQVMCQKGRGNYSAELVTLLDARIHICQDILSELKTSISTLNEDEAKTYSKLVSILRSLSSCSTRKKFPIGEVNQYVEQLKDIEESLGVEHKVGSAGKSYEDIYATLLTEARERQENSGPRSAEALIRDLLYRCFLWAHILAEKNGKIDERFKETYDRLNGIKNKLDNMLLTRAYSCRETDLYSYQRQLDRVDDNRVNGNFVDSDGQPADLHAQRTLLYLLRKSYALIYQLIITSEPVSESLMPIYNQLNTLRTCLVEVKQAGCISSPHDIYPYSMKLNSLDQMRVDGLFRVGDEIPEEQASVLQLYRDCFELAKELMVKAKGTQEEELADNTNGSTHSVPEVTAVN